MVALWAVCLLVAVLCCLLPVPSQGESSSSTASAGGAGTVVFSAPSTPFTPRTLGACAYEQSSSPPSATAAAYLLGGFNNGTAYNDVLLSVTSASFSAVSESSFSAPFSYGAGAALLLDGDLLSFGGEQGVADNDVWTSQDGGVSWQQVTANAGWSSRSLFAYTVLPLTDIVVIVGGQLASSAPSSLFNASDVWLCEDGVGRVWSQQSASPPFGSLVAAAAVGLYDHSLVVTGGISSGGYSNAVWLSLDLGVSWSAQPAAAFSPRAYHASAVDSDDIVYVIAGYNNRSAVGLDVWLSNTKGASWHSLSVSSASSSFTSLLSACAFVRAADSGLQLLLYGGQSSSGLPFAAVLGNLSVALSPASSTAISVDQSALQTAKPTLPPLVLSSAASASAVSAAAPAVASSSSISSSITSSSGVGSTSAAVASHGCSLTVSSLALAAASLYLLTVL